MWIFKIDNEFGSRGIAVFELDTIRAMNEILKNLTEISE